MSGTASKLTRLGRVNDAFDVFQLKSVLVKNDSGDWGEEPDSNAIGIIRSTNFNNDGKLDLTDVAYRTLKPSKRIEKLVFVGEILIERSGGSDSQPVGRVGLITDKIASEDFAFANFIQRIAVNESIDPNYLFYCMQQLYEMGITASMQYQTTGIRNLDWKFYTRTILPKPPKSEQIAIAAILTKIDDAIDATQNSINASEKLKKALMQNLLTGRLKPNGEWRSKGEFYEDANFGKVPVGWKVKPIGDKSVCEINPNYKFLKGKVYDFIPMDAIFDKFRGIGYLETKVIDGGGFTRFKLGDILFAKITPCTENGKVALIDEMNSEVGFASTEFIVFQPKDTIDNLFLYYVLSSHRVHQLAVSLMEGSTGRQRVPWKVFKNRIFAPIPDDASEQKAISAKLKSLEDFNSQKKNKIQSLKRLKKSLMQNLLIGKVRLDINALTNEDLNINVEQSYKSVIEQA